MWSISVIIVEDGKPRGRYTLTVLPVVHVPVIVCRSPCAAALWVKHFNEPHLCQGSQCWQWCCVAGSVLGPSWIHWCLCSAAHEREKMTQRCIGVRVRVRKWMAYGVLPRRQINSSYLLCNPWSISAHLGKKNPLVLHRNALICVLDIELMFSSSKMLCQVWGNDKPDKPQITYCCMYNIVWCPNVDKFCLRICVCVPSHT